jgi:hypothetical protein
MSNDMKKLKVLGKEDILKAEDIDTIEVEVPEWGGVVKLRAMPGSLRDEWESILVSRKKGSKLNLKGIKALAIAYAAVDEEGNLLFTTDDVKAINEKSSAPIERLADAVMKMNGLGEEDLKDLEKNLPSGQSDSSGSD